MNKVHLQGKSIADFGMVNVGNLDFSPYSSGIISKAIIESGEVLNDSLSKSSEECDRKKRAFAIEGRYKSKTAEAQPLKRAHEFSYFKLNEHRYSLYMFNPTDVKLKFQFKVATKAQYN